VQLKALGIFTGRGICNAHCKHCAGIPHRKFAPLIDGYINPNLEFILKNCFNKGARSLSISSSGEPTLSPLSITNTLKLINKISNEGYLYTKIHLYSNGIIIGNDDKYCETFLPQWKEFGLDTIYLTIHNINELENAKVYNVDVYPSIKTIINRTHKYGLLVRANLVLGKKTIPTPNDFFRTVTTLLEIGIDSISAWQIRDPKTDTIDQVNSLSITELETISNWLNDKQYNNVKFITETNHNEAYQDSKLTLFPDGSLSANWCQ
jgi:MoaA/NifB/PqqE/SkfB family radical SAM enzyme